ncbi:MAG: response regulator transcription factor [Gammaproteobacteria bacterium]|nr:response regulator transcription factor [Gammaproteobacteria bacterium]
METKILVVDDHELLLDSLEIILRDVSDDLQILKANTCKSASDIILNETELSLVLLDLNLPDAHGINLLLDLTNRYPLLPIVILSSSEDRIEMHQCLNNGALGFIPKTSPAKTIVHAVRLVLSGGIYIPEELLSDDNDTLAAQSKLQLTPRQIEVLKLLISGVSNKEIATTLGCAEATIKTHITAVLKGLGVANRTQAVLAAQKLGYFSNRTYPSQ